MRFRTIAAAVRFAEQHHAHQTYGDEPYTMHLAHTVEWLSKLAPKDSIPPHVFCAGWLHDVLEDTKATPEEVTAQFGEETATLVQACTAKGANRSERLQAVLDQIRALPEPARGQAALVKLADRCANVEASMKSDPGRLRMYRKEHPRFLALREFCPESPGWAALAQMLDMPG